MIGIDGFSKETFEANRVGADRDVVYDNVTRGDGDTSTKPVVISTMGGDISVESTAGAGSTFTIDLPLQVSEHAEQDTPAPAPAPVLATQGGDLVLVVDDDLRRVAGWILPKDVRKSRYKIEPFDYALHIAPKARGYREEIVVTIQILHRFNPYFPADECESLCLKEMCGKLKEFGVLEGRVKSGCGENG